MKIDLYLYQSKIVSTEIGEYHIDHNLYASPIGYIDIDKFNPLEIFHLCNWSRWTNERPINLHSKIDSCGHGLMMIDPITKKRFLSKSFSWLIGNEKTINNYVKKNRYQSYWK